MFSPIENSPPFPLFAKTPQQPLTPKALQQFAGRINRLQRRLSESRLEITLSPTVYENVTPRLSPLTLEQHDSLLPQKNSVTIGDEDYDLDSDHDSLPELREQPSTEYTTSGGTTTPLRVEISSPSKQRRSGVFVPSITVKDDEQVVSTLSLTNTPSNWERCAITTPDGRKVSMLDISQGRLHGSAKSDSSQVVDTLVSQSPNDHMRALSQLSVMVPGRDGSEYDDLSELSGSELSENDGFVLLDDDLKNNIKKEEKDYNGGRSRAVESMLLESAALVPFPSDISAAADNPGSPTRPESPSISPLPTVPQLSQRASVNRSLKRSRKRMRNRLQNILNEFDSHIEDLMSNVEKEVAQIKLDHRIRLADRASARSHRSSRSNGSSRSTRS